MHIVIEVVEYICQLRSRKVFVTYVLQTKVPKTAVDNLLILLSVASVMIKFPLKYVLLFGFLCLMLTVSIFMNPHMTSSFRLRHTFSKKVWINENKLVNLYILSFDFAARQPKITTELQKNKVYITYKILKNKKNMYS